MKACPCCGGESFRDLLALKQIPLSGKFRAAGSAALPRLDLNFEICAQCGLVRQASFARPPSYEEVDRPTTLQKPAHLGDVLEHLRSARIGAEDLILEIGSNDGAFLEALRGAGYANLQGVEPSRALAGAAASRGFHVENEYFGPELAALLVERLGKARAVICRHTLEHVPDPASFTRALRDCIDPDGGVALVEVPDGSAIPELHNVYELWDEHFYCFSATNLRLLLGRSGLRVDGIAVVPHLDTRNLVAWCRVESGQPQPGAPDSRETERWLSFARTLDAYRRQFATALDAAAQPVYFIGASHSQSNFANYMGAADRVDFMIDDDPSKVGHLAPLNGAGGLVITTEEFLRTASGGTVVRSGFGYPKWMDRICSHARTCGMAVIDPLALRPTESLSTK